MGIMGRVRKEVGINRRVRGVGLDEVEINGRGRGVCLERSGNKREREGSMSGKK